MTLSKARQISYASLGLALLIISAQISLPILTIAVTLQTLVVGLLATILPYRLNLMIILAYLTLGLLGLPIFANFTSGMSVLVGPTGGYLIGFLAYSTVTTIGIAWLGRQPLTLFGVTFVASISQLLIGTVWLLFYLKLTWPVALMTGFVPYVLIELIKCVLISQIAPRLRANLFKDS